MDKRKFLKSTALGAGALGVPAVAGAQTRLFGTPGSVIPINPESADRIRLALSHLSVPTPAWQLVVNAASAIQELVTSQAARQAFATAPTQYFAAHGVPGTAMPTGSREMAIARLAMDEVAQGAARTGDYAAFIERLKHFRVGTIPDSGGLIEKLTGVLKSNVKAYDAMKAALANVGGGGLEKAGVDVSPAVIGDQDSIAIDVDVLVMESAVAMIDVVVGAEVLVLAAAVATIVVIVSGAADPTEPLSRPAGVEAKLARLDPALMDFASNATTGARLLGNKSFEVKIAKDVLRRELEALVHASAAVGLLSVKAEQFPALIDIAFERACEGMGRA